MMKNVEDRAIVKGFTNTFKELYLSDAAAAASSMTSSSSPSSSLLIDGQTLAPKDIRTDDVVVSVNSTEIYEGGGFASMIEALKTANDNPNYSMQSYLAAVTSASNGGSCGSGLSPISGINAMSMVGVVINLFIY